MTPDKFTVLAARLLNHAAMHESIVPYDDEQRQWRDDLLDAARYLRQWAEVEPVTPARVHNIGGNAGIAWSGVPRSTLAPSSRRREAASDPEWVCRGEPCACETERAQPQEPEGATT